MSLMAFLMLLSYSIARPAVESMFLTRHTSQSLPLAWILVALGTVFFVQIYNNHVTHTNLVQLFGRVAVTSALSLVALLVAAALEIPGTTYALYIWKDIYIVILVENFYSFANSVYRIKTARWVYGVFGGAGAIGSITGNLTVGPMEALLGPINALWTLPPLLLLMWLGCLPFLSWAETLTAKHPPVEDLGKAFQIVRKSSYLMLVLLLIAVVQVVITLIDYEYNKILEINFTPDRLTATMGQVYALMNVITIALNALTGPLLRFTGVPFTLLSIPFLLGTGLLAFALSPRFITVVIVKVASKCFDYSIFRASKEILYIPLSYEERTRGKSIVDMITYRVAKAGASLFILGLLPTASVLHFLGNMMGDGADQIPAAQAQNHAERLVTPFTLILVLVWILTTVIVIRRFRKKVSRAEEMSTL